LKLILFVLTKSIVDIKAVLTSVCDLADPLARRIDGGWIIKIRVQNTVFCWLTHH